MVFLLLEKILEMDKNHLITFSYLDYDLSFAIYFRYAWRESPCPNGIENCAIYSSKQHNWHIGSASSTIHNW